MALTRSAAKAPIGLFDSGVGGLTVARAISQQLPNESLVYLGDTARTPYGTKAGKTVKRFSLECVHHLAAMRIKALVVACNTASAYALPTLRRHFDFPIIGVVKPGAQAAMKSGRHHAIGVIGTRATIQSQAYTKSIQQLRSNQRVYTAACPLLVPLVEEGWLDESVTQAIVARYLTPLLSKNIKQLILGCTHYPALKSLIAAVCGPQVTIIDSAEEVAKELKKVLITKKLLNSSNSPGSRRFVVTDVPEQFSKVGQCLFGKTIKPIKRITLAEKIV